MVKIITQYFPLWAVLLSAVAYYFPQGFVDLKTAIVPLLAVIMLGMGMTLTVDDFKRVAEKPGIILIGLLLQFLVMPLTAYIVSLSLGLPLAILTGMILVGASSGGTASNVICYLAKGNVALSITLTLCSTLLAVIAMPALTWLYLGERVPVPVWGMLYTVLKIVIVPVVAGVLVNHFAGEKLKTVKPWLPAVSVLAIVLIIAIVVALNQQRIAEISLLIVTAVILHNLIGLLSGYWVTKWLGHNQQTCRTLAIEVGMQNSGLSVALAIKYFSPLAALPAAIFSIWHNISGSLLASAWARTREKANDK
ncbi:MAG: bile acid:sodium symporter family protein [Gammaproteobacteria bacterium]|nr:bile acid:sodium symporter family protein [Gammaproteobacteria bacterium]